MIESTDTKDPPGAFTMDADPFAKKPEFTLTSDGYHATELLEFEGEKLNTSASRYNTLLAFIDAKQDDGGNPFRSPFFMAWVVFICSQPWEKLRPYHRNWAAFDDDFFKWTDTHDYRPGANSEEIDGIGEAVCESWEMFNTSDGAEGKEGAASGGSPGPTT